MLPYPPLPSFMETSGPNVGTHLHNAFTGLTLSSRGCSSVILETFLHNRIASPLSCCAAFDEELLRGYLRATSRPNRCGTLEWLIEQHK